MKKKKDMLFPIRLGNLIGALGITDCRFAELCGMTQAAISQILSGKREPSLETLRKIHMATGVSIDYLMGLKLGQPLDSQEESGKD